jgi:hypothetical protein
MPPPLNGNARGIRYGPSPPRKAKRPKPGSEGAHAQKQLTEANAQRDQRQVRIVKIGNHRKGHARVSNETANAEQLGGLALGILTYALSKPSDWKLYSWQLAKRFHCGEYAIRTAIRQLRASGRVRPVYERAKGRIIAQYWQLRESAELPWPTEAKYLNVIITDKKTAKQTQPFRREFTEDRNQKGKGRVAEVCSHEREGAEQTNGEQPSQRSLSSFVPNRSYPQSAEEGYETLEALGIQSEPDYDGLFFENMIANDWIIRGTGRPVYDWIATYVARLKRTMPGGYYGNEV